MSFKIQYKVTVWQELTIDDVRYSKEEIIKLLKDCSDISPWELFEAMDVNTLYETEETMTVEDNNGNETVELWQDGKIIWTNAETK